MKKLLWLDDYRDPYAELPGDGTWLVFSPIPGPYQIVWVKSYYAFTNWIERNGLPDAICFDHDLGEPPMGLTGELKEMYSKNGYDCAKWLVEFCMDRNLFLPAYSSQSANPVGKENILKLLDNYRDTVQVHTPNTINP